tara:strand:+ start:240 stop:998 length:759 start_codon:yes stop_codon:yes gene_type:complete
MNVNQIWRYPVKSLQGEQLASTQVEDSIPGDRGWGIIDTSTGLLLSAKRVPKLFDGQARIDGTDCIITFGGDEITSRDPKIDSRLSSWLEREVTLSEPTVGETKSIEIEWDDGSDESPDDPDIFEFSTSPGWFFDSSSSLHLIGTATLAFLDKRIGKGSGDVRRFRPNIVAGTKEPFEENNWVGKNLVIGDTEISVKKRTDRCIVITRAFGDYESSRATLRYLSANHDREAGISMSPITSGSIAVGDRIEVQ